MICCITGIYCFAVVAIIDTSKPEEFVDFTEDDFKLRYEDYLGVDMKQLIKDELAKQGQQLNSKVIKFLDNPIQGSGRFEGDIEIPTESMVDFSDENFSASAYAAIKRKQKLWVDGIIPYRISSNYGFLSKLHIIAAVKEINKNTCLKMVPYTDHDDYIVIKPKIGCSSFIGRVGGVQHVSISAGCTEKVTIIHEVMHAAGFYHEQARFDRDEHIIIHWNNIDPDPKIRSQFKKQNASVISTFGIPYDQYSIMHYQHDAFASQSGLVTISAINNEPLGNAKGLTKSDIDKLNTLYDCPGKPDLSVFEKKVSNLTTKANVNATTCDNSTSCHSNSDNDTGLILAALESASKPPDKAEYVPEMPGLKWLDGVKSGVRPKFMLSVPFGEEGEIDEYELKWVKDNEAQYENKWLRERFAAATDSVDTTVQIQSTRLLQGTFIFQLRSRNKFRLEDSGWGWLYNEIEVYVEPGVPGLEMFISRVNKYFHEHQMPYRPEFIMTPPPGEEGEIDEYFLKWIPKKEPFVRPLTHLWEGERIYVVQNANETMVQVNKRLQPGMYVFLLEARNKYRNEHYGWGIPTYEADFDI